MSTTHATTGGAGRRIGLPLALLLAMALAACSSSSGGSAARSTTSTVAVTSTPGSASTQPTDVAPRPASPVAVPTLTGPITGGTYGVPYNPMPPALERTYGYREDEYFMTGKAVGYRPDGPLPADGTWQVKADGAVAYETRILVRRPSDPAKFNGTVLVEWLNVSAGRDADPDFGFLYPDLLAKGYAWVGVSAQKTGVEGGAAPVPVPGVPKIALAPLKVWDATRYAPLHHPGDEYSFDIFSQAGQAVRHPGALDVLGGLKPTDVIAMGESQSAGRMVTYVDGINPLAHVYDGFFIHSRGAGAAAFDDASAGALPKTVAIRKDQSQPVLQFETETDLIALGFQAGRQPDADRIATWETAGTSHVDQANLDYGVASGQVWAKGVTFDATKLCGPINDGTQAMVARSAIEALRAWVEHGTRPPTSPRIEITNAKIDRNSLGIALGGIRTPSVDAPTEVLSGAGNPASILCSLFGTSTPLTAAQLHAEYRDHASYVAKVRSSVAAAVDAGFLLPVDGRSLVAAAASARVPG